MSSEATAAEKIRLLMRLRQSGIQDPQVLGAIEQVPREKFIPPELRGEAYDDKALPIAEGQTISQPSVVAWMTWTLQVTNRHRVLEIGTGSGYQAAILAKLCRRVYTIERHRALYKKAHDLFQELKLTNITDRLGDGTKGWPETAPFDRIIVTAAADEVPNTLLEQLAEGGVMIIPVGQQGQDQMLLRIRKQNGEIGMEQMMAVRFVPLVE